jgi:non-homologous end joining protein Ku
VARRHYPEQVRYCPLAAPPVGDGASEELRLAGLLIEAASGAVAWGGYRDQAAQELKALLEAKLAGQPQATTEPARAILPLLEALQQSVAELGSTAQSAPRSIDTPRDAKLTAERRPGKRKPPAAGFALPQFLVDAILPTFPVTRRDAG